MGTVVPLGNWCGAHGQYYGDRCPYCVYTYYPPPTVTISPDSTEAALAATVKALTQLINNLTEQVAERDRQIAELQRSSDD